MDNYNTWLQASDLDPETKEALNNLREPKEIEERFYKELEFGTGGLRGIMDIGTNRMNVYMVRKATKGLAGYLLSGAGSVRERGVVIAYDSRNHSREFAEAAALTLCSFQIKTFLFEEIEPTPVLSFAVRTLGAAAGIVITASHNPKEYNGYKVYNQEGCQILPQEAKRIQSEIKKVSSYLEKEDATLKEAEEKQILTWLDEEMERKFVDAILKEQKHGTDKALSVVYTPLHGTGNRPVQGLLKRAGVKLHVVKEQELPDGEFPTVKVPNPEEQSALDMGISLAKEKGADLVLGTDPDCDRIGVAVRHNGKYVLLSGNEIGALLAADILEQGKAGLGDGSFIAKTIVTGDLGARIAQSYGVKVTEVLTGFKYIGEKVNEDFIFGYEESFGYLAGTHVRDKDAAVAALLICEAAERYKEKGQTLADGLERLYQKYGYYREGQDSFVLPGKDGIERIQELMEQFRKDGIEIDGMDIAEVVDYQKGTCLLPASNVLKVFFKDGSWIAVRPSGTEPKLKVYYSFCAEESAISNQKYELARQKIKEAVLE